MMLCGDSGIEFRCKDITCILNQHFNIVLFTESTVLYGGAVTSLGFVVPTKYLSFIKTISKKHSYSTDLSKIFTFSNEKDKLRLQEFIETQKNDTSYEIIKDIL